MDSKTCNITVVSGMAFEAKLARASGIETIYGLDHEKLKDDIEQAIEAGAKSLISFGTAAGLSPVLHAGAIVIAREVHAGGKIFAADAAWQEKLRRELPDATIGYIAGVDEPLTTIKSKALLSKESGTVAADMESHLVAEIAEKYSIPFGALRVVLDDVSCQLPPAALAATSQTGHINYFGLFASLLTNPFQIPALLQLAKAQKQAKLSLLHCGDLLKRDGFGLMDLR